LSPEFVNGNDLFLKHNDVVKALKLDHAALSKALEKHDIAEATFAAVGRTQFAQHLGVSLEVIVERVINYYDKLSPTEPDCGTPLLTFLRCLEDLVFKSENGFLIRKTDPRKFAMMVGSLILHCVLQLGGCGKPEPRSYAAAVNRYMHPSANNADGLLTKREYAILLSQFGAPALPDAATTASPAATSATEPPKSDMQQVLEQLTKVGATLETVQKDQAKMNNAMGRVKTEFAEHKTEFTEFKASAVNRTPTAADPAASAKKKKEN
jgi:hypothetical protein